MATTGLQLRQHLGCNDYQGKQRQSPALPTKPLLLAPFALGRPRLQSGPVRPRTAWLLHRNLARLPGD
jgi:hypothetical protein